MAEHRPAWQCLPRIQFAHARGLIGRAHTKQSVPCTLTCTAVNIGPSSTAVPSVNDARRLSSWPSFIWRA